MISYSMLFSILGVYMPKLRKCLWLLLKDRKKGDGLRFYRTKFSYILYVMWMVRFTYSTMCSCCSRFSSLSNGILMWTLTRHTGQIWDANAKLKISHKTLICNKQTCVFILWSMEFLSLQIAAWHCLTTHWSTLHMSQR